MAVKFLDNTGLSYFWGKIKAWCSSTFAVITHTHSSTSLENVKHFYTTAANADKNWYRIANTNTSQIDADTPLHLQFFIRAQAQAAGVAYWQSWFVDLEVWGQQSGIRIFGNNSSVPFNQIRILYENTASAVTSSTRPAVDIYLNAVLTGGSVVNVEEVYNSGFEFVVDGVLSASTAPTGYESRAVSPYGSGIQNCSNSETTNLPAINISASTTLNSSTHVRRAIYCTGTITVTIPSLNSNSVWYIVKNCGTGVVTLHPVSTSVFFDNVSADITLQPGEFIRLACQSNSHYSIIDDGRWKSQKANYADVVHIAGTETITGAKTFSSNVAITKGNPILTCKNTSTETTVYPSSGNQDARMNFQDKNGHPLGSILHRIRPTDSAMYLRVFNFNRTDSENAWSDIAIGYDNNGNIYTSAPTPAVADNSTKIATTAFVKSQGYLTSHQTLPTLSRTISGSGNAITDITVSNHAITATKGTTFLTSHQSLAAYATLASPALTGTPTAPTPSTSDNSTKIATTAYVNSYVGTFIAAQDEVLTLSSNVTSGNRITLPSGMQYKVGTNALQVSYNGTVCHIGKQYTEYGNSGSLSTQITLLLNAYSGDEFGFRIQGTSDLSGTSVATSLPWVSITNKPTNFTPSSHSHGSITNDGKLGTASRAVVTDGNKLIDVSTVTAAELGYLSGVTSAVQTQLNAKATDSSAVHKTGAETIAGVKTFSDNLVSTSTFCQQQTGFTKGTNPSGNVYWTLRFCDKDGTGYEANTIGQFQTRVDRDGLVATHLRAMSNTASSDENCQITCYYDTANSVGYTAAPTPSSTADDSTKIATTAWVRSATGSFACNAATATTLATARTINGVSFDGSFDITVADSTKLPLTGGTLTGGMTMKRANHTRGTAPSSTSYFSCADFKDSANNRFGLIENAYYQNKSSVTAIYAYNTTIASGGSIGSLGIGCDTSGDVYTVAPTPAASDNSTKIATTAYVKAQGYADSEDVSSTFTWESGEAPAHFFAYRVGKLVHVFFQGKSKTHSNGDILGTTTLTIADQTLIPFVKNASAYGLINIAVETGGGTVLIVNSISSTSASGRIYFNGAFLIS